jgi:hypothetical protein
VKRLQETVLNLQLLAQILGPILDYNPKTGFPMKIKLLIVEDNEQELGTCRSSIKRYQAQKNRQIEIIECKTIEQAKEKLDASFDGAIVDLNLGTDGYTGNDVIKEIFTSFRIPAAILTGTPQNAILVTESIKVYTRGEIEYVELFDIFFDVYNTGLTKILGGRGDIEKIMHRVFWTHLLPNIDGWMAYVSNGKDTEKALLRFTINHLLELLDDEINSCFPEEMYIFPPVSDQIRTGSIVNAEGTDLYYVVLSPACDLVLHQGNMKTNRILICDIEKRDMEQIVKARKNSQIEIIDSDEQQLREEKERKKATAEDFLTRLTNNSYSNYYHYLPKTRRFDGGIIDFRKVSAFKPSEFKNKFKKPKIQISVAFTKDIVSRFSSYYARQGQPNFDSIALVEDLRKG